MKKKYINPISKYTSLNLESLMCQSGFSDLGDNDTIPIPDNPYDYPGNSDGHGHGTGGHGPGGNGNHWGWGH